MNIYLNMREDMNVRKVSVKLVPRVINDKEKEKRDRLVPLELDTSKSIELQSMVTCSKSWIYSCDIEPWDRVPNGFMQGNLACRKPAYKAGV